MTHALAASLSLLALAMPAAAATRTISIPITGFKLSPNIGISNIQAIVPDASSLFATQFVLPPDYKANSTVRLKLYFVEHGNACSMYLGTAEARRVRNGAGSSLDLGGISLSGGPLVTFPAAQNGVGIVKTVRIAPSPNGPFSGQKPGDLISVSVARLASQASDTCDELLFMGASLSYTRK